MFSKILFDANFNRSCRVPDSKETLARISSSMTSVFLHRPSRGNRHDHATRTANTLTPLRVNFGAFRSKYRHNGGMKPRYTCSSVDETRKSPDRWQSELAGLASAHTFFHSPPLVNSSVFTYTEARAHVDARR